jgi:hypothetical protein
MISKPEAVAVGELSNCDTAGGGRMNLLSPVLEQQKNRRSFFAGFSFY